MSRQRICVLCFLVILALSCVVYAVERFRVDVPANGVIIARYGLDIQPTSLDFGTIYINESVAKMFTVKNTGDEDVYLYTWLDLDRSTFPEDLTYGFYRSSSQGTLANGTLLASGNTQPFNIEITAGQAKGTFNMTFVLSAHDTPIT